MKYTILLLVLFCAANASAQTSIAYTNYCNSRFGYCLTYPVSILVPQPVADNGDGRKFLSNDNEVEMLVYGTENALDQTLAGMYRAELA